MTFHYDLARGAGAPRAHGARRPVAGLSPEPGAWRRMLELGIDALAARSGEGA